MFFKFKYFKIIIGILSLSAFLSLDTNYSEAQTRNDQSSRDPSRLDPAGDFFSGSKDSPFSVSPVVSLVVNGSDSSHLSQALSNAVNLSRKVPVRNLLILYQGDQVEALSYHPETVTEAESESDFLKQFKFTPPQNPYAKYFKDLKLYTSSIKAEDTLLDRLRINYSPTWIVRFEGRDYVYEGYQDISKMFSREGGFTPER